MSYASAAMCYEAIICPRCSSVGIVKNGKTAQRKQRYLCKDCRRQFIRDYTNLGCVGAVRDLVVPLTINGAGIRDIERVLFLSTNTILKTLLEAATLEDDPAYPRRVHDLEMDEFWSFVGAKRRQRWTWYGYDRQRRNVGTFVNERRTDAACRQLLQKLDGCQITRYHTDNWQSSAKLLPTRHSPYVAETYLFCPQSPPRIYRSRISAPLLKELRNPVIPGRLRS